MHESLLFFFRTRYVSWWMSHVIERIDVHNFVFQLRNIQFFFRMTENRWTINEYVTYILLTLVFLASWTDINGIFAELPQIILTQPEGARLGAYLALITNFGNIAPLILILIKCFNKKQTLNPVPINYIVITIGMASCFLLIFFWQYTRMIFNQNYSNTFSTISQKNFGLKSNKNNRERQTYKK